MIIDPYTWNRVKVQHAERITPDTLSVVMPRPHGYNYRPGQYTIIRTPVNGGLLRQYSFASCPNDDFLEFLIQKETGGAVSCWFHGAATAGVTLELSQPFGSFVAPDNDRPLLLVAGRVGVAPFVSIIRDHLARDTKRSVTLLYSARGPKQFCYPDLLGEIDAHLFDTAHGSRLCANDLARHLVNRPNIMLCGSKKFVDDMHAMLVELGTDASDIKREPFTLQ